MGDLRAALRGVPDHTPLLVAPGPEPGGQPAPADRVIIAAGHHRHTWRDHAELSIEMVLSCTAEPQAAETPTRRAVRNHH